MADKKILITAATGVTGSAAIANLLGLGIPVRALVHRIDARSEQLRAQGAEIIEGDLLDFAVLDRALIGITGASLLSNSDTGDHRIDCLLHASRSGRRRRHHREHVTDISTQSFKERGCQEPLDS